MPKSVLSIEFVHDNYWLCARGTYDRSSVLAGEDYRQLQVPYDTLEAAQAANPGVAVSDEGAPIVRELPTSAPSWFDPMDAGEAWGEDDY